MKLTIDATSLGYNGNQELIVRFGRHESEKTGAIVTTCYGKIGDLKIFEEHASCHTNDRFSKAGGRKAAMTKAIKYFPKPIRTAIWNQYHTEHADRRHGN